MLVGTFTFSYSASLDREWLEGDCVVRGQQSDRFKLESLVCSWCPKEQENLPRSSAGRANEDHKRSHEDIDSNAKP